MKKEKDIKLFKRIDLILKIIGGIGLLSFLTGLITLVGDNKTVSIILIVFGILSVGVNQIWMNKCYKAGLYDKTDLY